MRVHKDGSISVEAGEVRPAFCPYCRIFYRVDEGSFASRCRLCFSFIIHAEIPIEIRQQNAKVYSMPEPPSP